MEFRVLGPVEMRVGGRRVDVGHARQRAVLAVLLLELNRVVSADRLIDRVWGEAPPASVRNVVYGLVARLRAAITAASEPGLELSRRAAGYVLEADPELLDLHRFRQQATLAATAKGDDDASAHLRTALSNWHGEALAGVSSVWLGSMRHTLEQLRTAAILELNDIALRRGQHHSLIAELTELSSAHENNERAAGQLMLALYRSGQPAEALQWFEQIRQRLADQFGADPGPRLQELHQQILRNDPALMQSRQQSARSSAAASLVVPRELAADVPVFARPDRELAGLDTLASNPADRPANRAGHAASRPATPGLAAVVKSAVSGAAGVERASPTLALAASAAPSPAAGPATGEQGAAVPRQLPAAVGCFTGRDGELAALTSLLEPGPSAPTTTMVISAISGTAGVGKTALAIQWAHQVAARFPDGQLYVNLRGYDPDQPVTPADALAGFLAALGVPGPRIPEEEADRAAAYRSVLAGRRVLIVADNARGSDQVRPLLPGCPGCLLIVTSRDTLAGLVARDGARRVVLDALPVADAMALLRALIGPRVDAEPQAAARLAELCCRLPLALRVAAERAAARPALTLAALAAELDQHGRLDALEADGDQTTAVRAVFSWSYRHLSPRAARAFRLAGLHPGTDFDTHAVAALTATSRQQADRALAELTRVSLLHQTDSGRHSMHDLLRAYAAELALANDQEPDRREALTRLFEYYLHTTRRAVGLLFPADVPAPADAPGEVPAAVVSDEQAARAWLDAERANLTAITVYASGHRWPDHAASLSASLFRYLDVGGFFDQALVIHNAALKSAVQAGERAAEACAAVNLGGVYLSLSRFPPAVNYCQRALTLAREASDRPGELRALGNLGLIYIRVGEYGKAAEFNQQLLDLSRALGDRVREARALLSVGRVAIFQGRYRQAAAYLLKAVEASRPTGDQACLIFALFNLGELELRQGRYGEARSHLQEAWTISCQIGHVIGEAHATCFLGVADLREGHYQQAGQHLERALKTFREAAAKEPEAWTLCYLGEVDQRRGRLDHAVRSWEQALSIFRETAVVAGEAQARNGLAEVCRAAGAFGDARAHHKAALASAEQIDSPQQQARAHEGLGDIAAAGGDAAEAQYHWQQALVLYTSMDVPEADRVRAKLVTPT
jgi:DNA-binding SARP family transcriptional activator/tetratricopeptide (TPR) repeat protein